MTTNYGWHSLCRVALIGLLIASATAEVGSDLDLLSNTSESERIAAISRLTESYTSAKPGLAQALSGTDCRQRAGVAEVFRRVQDPDSVPILLTAVCTLNRGVREPCAAALKAMAPRQAVEALRPRLTDPAVEVRWAAVLALGALGEADGLAAAAELAKDRDASVREAVAAAVRSAAAATHLPTLLALLRDGSPEVRCAAAGSLGGSASPDALAALVAATRDGSPLVRAEAAWSLSSFTDDTATQALLATLRDADLGTVLNAAAALQGRLGPAHAGALAEVANQATGASRIAATQLLAGSGQEGHASLVALLSSGSQEIRAAAAEVLGAVGGEKVASLLLKATSDSDPAVRLAALEGCREAKPAELRARLVELTNDPVAEVRQAAMAVGVEGRAIPADALVARLGDEDDTVRQAAVRLLIELDRAAAFTAFRNGLADEAILPVRQTCAAGMAALGDPASLPQLLALLSDRDAETQAMGMAGLRRLGRVAVPGLLEALRGNQPAAAAAAECLGLVGDPTTADAVAERLAVFEGARDWSGVAATAIALGSLGDSRAVPALKNVASSKSELDRADAVEALGKIQDVLAAEVLAERLRDRHQNVYPQTLASLARLGSIAVPVLCRELQNRDGFIQSGAAEALVQIRDLESLAALQTLVDANQAGSARAIEAIGALPGEQATQRLLAGLKHANRDVRVQAAKSLGQRVGVECLDGLRAALAEERDFLVTTAILGSLAQHGDREVVERLIPVLNAKDPNVAKGACEALATLGDERAVPALVGRLQSHPILREAAAAALVDCQDDRAMGPLLALVKSTLNEDRAARKYAALFLSDKSDSAAVSAIAVAMTVALRSELFLAFRTKRYTWGDWEILIDVVSGDAARRNYSRFAALQIEEVHERAARLEFTHALGRRPDPRCLDVLAEVVRRKAVMRVLIKQQTKRGLMTYSKVVGRKRDSSQDELQSAVAGLAAQTGQDFGTNGQLWSAWLWQRNRDGGQGSP